MKSKILSAVAALVTVCALFSSCATDPPDDQPTQSMASVRPGARTMEVARGDLTYETTLSSSMVPIHVSNLYFKDVSGPLMSKTVKLYDRIAKGQTLAEIDSTDLERDLARAELQMQVYELQRKNSDLNIKILGIRVDQYKLSLDNAKTLYADDPSDVNKRSRDLAQLYYDEAVNNLSSAELNRSIAALNYEDFLISYERVKARLQNRIMEAPDGGVIVSVDPLEVGETITAGKYLYKYVRWSDMAFKISGSYAVNIFGQKNIRVTVNGAEYTAHDYVPIPGDDIFSLNDIGSKTLAYLVFDGDVPDVELQVSQVLNIRIEKKDALYVNRKCLRSSGGVIFVNRKTDDGFEQVPVVCGIESGDNVEILSGLSEGDVVAMD